MTDTQEILARLKAVCEAATDGPWVITECGGVDAQTAGTNIALFDCAGDCLTAPPYVLEDQRAKDATLAALSRTALPALVEALERTIAHLDFWIADAPQDPEVMEQGKVIRPCDVRAIISDALAPLKDKLP